MSTNFDRCSWLVNFDLYLSVERPWVSKSALKECLIVSVSSRTENTLRKFSKWPSPRGAGVWSETSVWVCMGLHGCVHILEENFFGSYVGVKGVC